VKPFSPRELVARVRALLRRSLRQGGGQGSGQPASQTYQTSHFIVDIDQRTASQKAEGKQPKQLGAEGAQLGQENTQSPSPDPQLSHLLELTPLEFDLLATFMSYPGRVWNRTQLIEKLWGNDFFGDERVVDAHIARLRKKIEPNPSAPSYIKTVVGVGYRFEDG